MKTLVRNTMSGIKGFIQVKSEIADQFKLHQNYPNPYWGKTTIPFSLPEKSDVVIELYDVSAMRVAVITKNNLPAGDHHIELDTNILGIPVCNYIYQVIATNPSGVFRQSKIMMTLK